MLYLKNSKVINFTFLMVVIIVGGDPTLAEMLQKRKFNSKCKKLIKEYKKNNN